MGGLQEAVEESSWRVAGREPLRHQARRVRPRLADRLLPVALAAVPATAVCLFGAVDSRHALPLEAAALLLGAWAIVVRSRRGDRPLPLPGVTIPVLLLAALPAIQLLPWPAGVPALVAPGLQRFGLTSVPTFTVDTAATTLALLRWLSYAAFLIAALELLQRPGAVVTALTVVAALGILEAVYGVGNLLSGNGRLLWLERPGTTTDATGTLVNRNHYAAVLELCLPAVLARHWLVARTRHTDEAGTRGLVILAAAAMGLAAFLSHSRAGIVCLGAGLGLGSVLAGRAVAARRTAIVVVVLSLAYGSWLGIGPLVGRFAMLSRDSTSERAALWRDAVDVAVDFPVAGVGAGAFQAAFPAFRRRLTGEAAWAHAHQDTLELAIEVGVGGLILALIGLGAFVRRLRHVLATADPEARAASAMLAGGTAAVLLHAQVDFPLHIPGIVWLLLLVAAAAVNAVSSPSPASARSASNVNRRPP